MFEILGRKLTLFCIVTRRGLAYSKEGHSSPTIHLLKVRGIRLCLPHG